MEVRLAEGGWAKALKSAIQADSSAVRIATPSVKKGAVEELFEGVEAPSIQVMTRFNLDNFNEGVSDLSALRVLLALGAQIRGVKRLNAKLYMFGPARAVISQVPARGVGVRHDRR